MTKNAIADLKWFRDNGPIGWFDAAAPSSAMRRRLEKAGLIEALPTETMRVVKYQISAAGLAELQSISKGG